jgi:hypothetical protein
MAHCPGGRLPSTGYRSSKSGRACRPPGCGWSHRRPWEPASPQSPPGAGNPYPRPHPHPRSGPRSGPRSDPHPRAPRRRVQARRGRRPPRRWTRGGGRRGTSGRMGGSRTRRARRQRCSDRRHRLPSRPPVSLPPRATCPPPPARPRAGTRHSHPRSQRRAACATAPPALEPPEPPTPSTPPRSLARRRRQRGRRSGKRSGWRRKPRCHKPRRLTDDWQTDWLTGRRLGTAGRWAAARRTPPRAPVAGQW